jgi:diacylglycerol kinase
MKSHAITFSIALSCFKISNAGCQADADVIVDFRMKMFLFLFVLVFCSLIDLQASEHVQEYISVWVPVHSL